MPPSENPSPDATSCSVCGSALAPDGHCRKCADRTVIRIIRRDLMLLTALALAAGLVFFATRQFASAETRAIRREARNWYQRGVQAEQGSDWAAATVYFRRAVAGDRDNVRYSLALVKALEQSNKNSEARELLLNLRDADPEDAEINLEIARLAAKRKDFTEASHFYQHALFGSWSEGNANKRRVETRFELLRFELAQNQRDAALSDALMLEADLRPADVDQWVELGNIYLQMGEAARALNAFDTVRRADRNNGQALFGAAKANFLLGRFATAQSELQSARGKINAGSNASQEVSSEVSSLDDQLRVISNIDPRARNLTRAERVHRTVTMLDHAITRLQGCSSGDTAGRQKLTSLTEHLQSLRSTVQTKLSEDELADAISLVNEAESSAASMCGAGDDTDRALLALTNASGKER